MKTTSNVSTEKRKRLPIRVLVSGLSLCVSSHYWGLPVLLVQGLNVQTNSNMGKSGFVRKHMKSVKDKLPVDMLVSSSDQVLQSVRQNKERIQGSKNYMKGWKHWVDMAIPSIRHELLRNLPHPIQSEEWDQLSFDLGVAADRGQMPCFASPGARSGYALDYFCRSRRLAGLFVDVANPTLPPFWTNEIARGGIIHSQRDGEPSNRVVNAIAYLTGSVVQPSTTSISGNTSVRLTSLGGGPGFDFVAAALAVTFTSSGDTSRLPSLQATILDYEEGWEDLVVAMDASTRNILQQSDWSCSWGGKCDITKPLNHLNNEACLAVISSTDIWTCQYCVVENAQKLRESHYIFFRDIWNAIPTGTIMIVTETTPRLWQEFYQSIQEHCPFMQVAFPHQRGYQLLLRKCDPSTTSQEDLELGVNEKDLLRNFQAMSNKHDERLRSGWERQSKKQNLQVVGG